MINKRSVFHCLVCWIMLLCPAAWFSAFGQTTFIQHYTTKDGLPSDNCYYTTQDSKGYIWIGTDAGVSRFDGKRFENFSIDDGLPDNQVIKIKEDNQGRIWFIAFNGELSYYLDGIIYNHINHKALRLLKLNAVVISMHQDRQDRLWFGTNKNMLFMFDGKALHKYTVNSKTDQFYYTHINEDKEGKIWAYSNQSIRVYEKGQFKLLAREPVRPLNYKTIIDLPDNTLLFIDKSGFNYLKGQVRKKSFQIAPSLLNDNLGYFYANAKELWLAHNDGIYHQDEHGKVTNYMQGIPTVQVIKGKNGNMWFTTKTGIYRLPRKENRLFMINKEHGLSSNAVRSITKDKHDQIWLGMASGYLNKIKPVGLQVEKIKIPEKKSFNSGVKKLILDEAKQSLYFASENGLGILNNIYNKTSFTFLKETSHSEFVIKDFSVSKNGELALALASGVVLLKDIKNKLEFDIYNVEKGVNFFNNRSYSVFYDTNGHLWFANSQGLNKLISQKIYPHYKNQQLSERINDIDKLPDGTLVIATDGYGLIFLKENKIVQHFTQKNGLISNICTKIFIDNNHVWVVTNGGINSICLDKSEPVVKYFEHTNALLKHNVNDLFVDPNIAYFATNSGLVYFQHTPHHVSIETPKAMISGIDVNGKKSSIKDAHIVLGPGNNKIAFYYGAINFHGQDILFRYRIRAGDEWTETINRRIDATSLDPGKYSFEVCAKTNNSTWGPSFKVSFEKRGHFWQSNWFLFLLFVMAVATFYRIAVLVTKKQKDKEQQQLLLKNKVLMLEQKALQAMMNPHFVFNVMNSIQHYINTKDTGSANKVLTGFARLIRKNMEICTKSYISLQEEIEYLELYLSLEKKRFGHKLNYEIRIDPQIDKEETVIPSMLLQPYIENAIWHGIMPMENGGDIKIILNLKAQNTLHIEIMDNGIGIENSLKQKRNTHTSKGMSLTQERINLLNQIEANPIQIKVQQNGASGTSVLIFITLQ